MNDINFSVYKNTLKRTDGFSPVSGEGNYTRLIFHFRPGDDWDNCTAVTVSYYKGNRSATHSNTAVSDGTATFTVPDEVIRPDHKIYFCLQGSYTEGSVQRTIVTNVIALNVNRGYIVEEGAAQNVYESLLAAVNQIAAAKANAADVTAALALKANAADVYTKTEADAGFASKASFNTFVTETYDDDMTDLEDAIDLKANSSDVTAALALKANSSDVTAALALKADAADVYTKTEADAGFASKASFNTFVTETYDDDMTDLEDAIDLKANSSDVAAALALKANSSDVAAALALKANASDTFNLFNKDELIYGKSYKKTDGTITNGPGGTACLMFPVDSDRHRRVRFNKRFYRVNLYDSTKTHIPNSGIDGKFAVQIEGTNAAYLGLTLNVSGATMGVVPSCDPNEVMAAYTDETGQASEDKWSELFANLPSYVPYGVFIDKSLYGNVNTTQTTVSGIQGSVSSLNNFLDSISDRITPAQVISALSEVPGVTASGETATITGTGTTTTWATITAKAYPGKAYILEFYGITSSDTYVSGTGSASFLTVEFRDASNSIIGGKYNGYVMGTTNMGYHRYGFVSPWGTKSMQLRFVTRSSNNMTIRDVRLTPSDCYPQRQRNGILLDGHLGAALVAPRNTMPCFELGKIAGSNTIITNIKATSDNVLVALHDQTIDNTSDGTGDVKEKTFEQLQGYDFGSKFNAAYAGTKIPKFETVVKFLAGSGIRLGVSIHGTLSNDNLADMCAIIKKYDMQDCLIKAFEMEFINEVHAILGDDAEYMLCAGQALPTTATVDALAALNARATFEFNCDYTTGAEEVIAYCRENGVKTSAYLVNNVQLMKALINMGITRFTTDMFSDIVFPMD